MNRIKKLIKLERSGSMLSFDEKKQIFDSFEELTLTKVSLGRLNYHFEGSAVPKTIVIKYLHPKSGNAFVYAGYLPKEETKEGYLSVHDLEETAIRELVVKALDFLKKTEDGYVEGYEEVWRDDHHDQLILRYSQPIWLIVMTTGSVEAVFKTKEAAKSYLNDEGFFE